MAHMNHDHGLHVIQVGDPYHPGIDWTGAVPQLRLTAAGAEFILPMSAPARHELRAFQATAEFAIYPGDTWLLLLYQFSDPRDSNPRHGLPWSDAAWEYHQQAKVEQPVVPGERGSSFLLRLVLVDADDGLVQAIRVLSPTVHFADALRDAVARQAVHPAATDPKQSVREIHAVYDRYSSQELVLRSTARFEALRDDTTR